MNVTILLEVIQGVIGCIKEGMSLFSMYNEHYKTLKNKEEVQERKEKYLLEYRVVNLNKERENSKQRKVYDNVLLYISDFLYDLEEFQSNINRYTNIEIESFNDGDKLEHISSAMAQHQKESVIVIRSNYKRKKLTLQLDVLNIVPGNDNLCYQIACAVECDVLDEKNRKLVSRLLSGIVDELMQTYQKYQQTVEESMARLELEARILRNEGHKNINFKQIDMGFGLEIELGRRKLIIGIPFEYPHKAPTVVLVKDRQYSQIEFGSDWEPFFTIEHIVKAVEGGG